MISLPYSAHPEVMISTDADSMRLWLLIHCWQSVGDNIRPMGQPDQQSYFTLLGDQQWERPQNEIENTGTCIHWVWISCLDDAEYGNHALRWPKHGKWSSQNCSQSSLSRSGQRGFSSESSIKSYCMTLYGIKHYFLSLPRRADPPS